MMVLLTAYLKAGLLEPVVVDSEIRERRMEF